MTGQFTTEGIDGLSALPRAVPPGWRVRFRSKHAGMAHQLYVNGRLADWTDTTDRRSFTLDDYGPCELTVAAVAPRERATDFSHLLPDEVRRPAWVFEAAIPRGTDLGRSDRIEATIVGEAGPIASFEAWPEHIRRWAWGEDRFGKGGFGYDGSLAPGAGLGAFGAGAFGMDADVIRLRMPIPATGEHEITIRSVSDKGPAAELPPIQFISAPPPAAPESIAVAAYDNQTQTVTLQIQRG